MAGELHIGNDQFQYIARISHGKDSLKMLDVIVSRGLRLDRITTTDIWATDTIRGEHPKMVKFKEIADEFIWRKYRIEVEHLCAMRNGQKVTYQQEFYRLPQRSDGAAIIRGWPMRKMPWCQHLKTDIKDPNKRGKAVEYIGIAADEPKRHGQLNERKRAPLVEFGIEEDLCGLYCKYQGILGPSYENSCRDGCWMCHNQGVNQLRQLRKEYPELWSIMLAWDRDSPWSFKQPSRGGAGHTVQDYERRFQLEDEHFLVPGYPRFKWSMLDDDLQYRLF